MNAQAKFNKLVTDALKPFFKEKGFNVPGQSFYQDKSHLRTIFQIQKSRWCDDENVELT